MIAAVADVHSPRYLPLFVASVSYLRAKSEKIDLVIFAGDMVERNAVTSLQPIVIAAQKLMSRHNSAPPILAVFGNEEYVGYEHEYTSKYPQIIWLDDEHSVVELEKAKICVIGSRGILLKPTVWQQKHLLNIETLYNVRIERIKNLLKICRDYDLSILITHYASTFATVYGEKTEIHKFLGYPLIDLIDEDLRPHIAIHGHAHNATKTTAIIKNTTVYNVSLPANKKITTINLSI